MSDSNSIETVAEFIDSDHPAFSLQFWPANVPRAHIIYLPPFAEEMNRCRSIVATQARWFAQQGLACTVLDYYGSGESQGELENATLAIWHENMGHAIQSAKERSDTPIYLWGFRLGALLAVDYASRQPDMAAKLLLWQPVTSGKSFLTQMLRQRAASLMQTGQVAETTAQMRTQLAVGDTIEVAGYRLGGVLSTAIDQLEMAEANVSSHDIFWLEHCVDGSNNPGSKSLRVIEQLRSGGAQVSTSVFTGDPIWQLNKRGICDDLIAKTRALDL